MNRIDLDGDERDFIFYREGSGGTTEIFDIAVGSQRSCGKGRRLIEEVVKRVKPYSSRLFAFVRMSNTPAHHFYQKVGFTEFVVLLDFYGDEDAVLFIRRI